MVGRLILGDDTGIGKCVVGDTKVLTEDGVIKITDKSLWGYRCLSDLQEDTFYDLKKKIASDGIKETSQVYFGGIKPTIKFKTKLGTKGHSTYNHRWKVMEPSGNIVWKKTKELKVDDYVAVGRGQELWGNTKLNTDEAWLLGFLVGDGSYKEYEFENRNNSANLSITCTDDETIQRLKSCCGKYFKNSSIKKVNGRKEGYLPQTLFRELGTKNKLDFLNKYGFETNQTALTKTLPEIIRTSDKRTFCNFLQGLFDADGYISKEGAIELCLASKDIIEDIQIYLLNMNIVCSITQKYNKDYDRYYYTLRVLENSGKRKFFNWINFSVPFKKERLREIVYKEKISNQAHDILPFQHRRILNIHNSIPKNLRWAFKNNNRAKDGKSNLSYTCAKRLLSFEHETFFQNNKDFQELKEIVSNNYFFTPITEIEDGGYQPVYDLAVPDGNTYLANGMVSHNTYQTIAAYSLLKTRNPNLKLMIICPSSVMYQWKSEFEKFTTGISSHIVESKTLKYVEDKYLPPKVKSKLKEVYLDRYEDHVNGGKLKSKQYLTSYDSREYQFNNWETDNKDVLIFNYNTMGSDYLNVLEHLMQRHDFMVVFDEATAFKSKKSQTWDSAKRVSAAAKRAYALSATIIKNDLLEAFAIIHVIMPYIFGNETRFKKQYCRMKKKQLWKGKGKRGKVIYEIEGYKNLDHFKKLLDMYYLGRKKSEVATELPEIITRDIPITMHPKQATIYQDVLDGFLDFDKFNMEKVKNLISEDKDVVFESQEAKQIDKLTALIYCQQICNSPHTIGIDAPSSKEEEALRILQDELYKEKVVIYTRFKRMVNRLEDLITKKLGMNVLKITGDVPNETREEYKKLFNTSTDHNIMIINGAAKEGINLQSSGYLLFYDLPFSYGDFLQIIGRIHRIGSKHGSKHDKIFLMYLICRGTVDEKVYNILANKKEIFDEILGDSAVGAIRNKDKELVNTLFEDLIKDAQAA
jgi:intein/homing endonuclease